MRFLSARRNLGWKGRDGEIYILSFGRIMRTDPICEINREPLFWGVFATGIASYVLLSDRFFPGDWLLILLLFILVANYFLPHKHVVTVIGYEGEGYIRAQYTAFPFLIRELVKINGYDRSPDRSHVDKYLARKIVGKNAVCIAVWWHNRCLKPNSTLARVMIDDSDVLDLVNSEEYQ